MAQADTATRGRAGAQVEEAQREEEAVHITLRVEVDRSIFLEIKQADRNHSPLRQEILFLSPWRRKKRRHDQ